ncbi:MAG: hypothetical protein KGH78_02105 [Candidatus Micrarchaeota archaeon]|nr:hypothetical protein [Candidatus Micrarchaeota archaeon]
MASKHRVEVIAESISKRLDQGRMADSEIREELSKLVFPNDRAPGNKTLLHLLARVNRRGVGRVIHIAINEFELRVNARDIPMYDTPSHVALASENEEAFVALRINNADLLAKNRLGENPEEFAGRNLSLAAIEMVKGEPKPELVRLVRRKSAKV